MVFDRLLLYEVRLTPSAAADIIRIGAYIRDQGRPKAAAAMEAKLVAAVDPLSQHPRVGRSIGREVYELTTVRPYVIRYRIVGQRVEVVRIRHGARRPD